MAADKVVREDWAGMHHACFIRSGKMLALPLCFPGVSTPIPADESQVTALAVTGDADIYGGTSGRRAHLFGTMLRGVTGFTLDLGPVEDADQCVAVVCGREKLFACVNGRQGGRVVSHEYIETPF
ncbi:unnamed protein product, partial [marine sediment metagenome]